MNADQQIHVAVDAQGGDFGPPVTVAACLIALQQYPDLVISLVGIQSQLTSELKKHNPDAGLSDRLHLIPADSVIPMDAKARTALRQKDSSLWKALELVSDGQAQSCVSAGNTGALMIVARKVLGLLPGIERPALMSLIPVVRDSNAQRHTCLLDLGANLHVSAEQLVQFAIMGSVAASHSSVSDYPKVGLLNVGHEDSKGHAVVQDADNLLKDLARNPRSHFEYLGFIEGNDIFSGQVDVAVCDGFSGNLVLKSSEGLARMLFSSLKDSLNDGIRSKIGAWLLAPSLKSMLERFDPSAHNGAPLLGMNGVVIKSHGSADIEATTQAITEAIRETRNKVPQQIESLVSTYQEEAEA